MTRLIVASNRVALIEEGKAAAGGLAVAVNEALSEHGGIWFGWSGQIRAEGISRVTRQRKGRITYATVDLTRQDYDLYYRGYSNSTLWPLMHYRLDLLSVHSRYVDGYRRVNAALAGKLAKLIEPEDLIWVHDYHLIPLAEELRKAGIGNRIGFFLHVPFPPPDVLMACSEHRDIVRNLMAFDLIGLQTQNDVENFSAYVHRTIEGRVDRHRIMAFGRQASLRAFPIGVHPEALQQSAARAANGGAARRLMASLKAGKLLIGVDRLDYTKGVDKRFVAFAELLSRYAENRGDATLMQIAPRSRTDVETYRRIRAQLESLAGQINGQYADIDWMPIRYLNRGFSREVLSGFFRLARVALVTPLRDGMNLVAKEYVASQNPEDPGVLILSCFAGAAEDLREAILVNPYDAEQMAEAMQSALQMSLKERVDRWTALYERLQKGNLSAWQDSFLQALVES